jgi:hypothetical protein
MMQEKAKEKINTIPSHNPTYQLVKKKLSILFLPSNVLGVTARWTPKSFIFVIQSVKTIYNSVVHAVGIAAKRNPVTHLKSNARMQINSRSLVRA